MAFGCILCGAESVFPLIILKPEKTIGYRQFLRCQLCELIFVPQGFHLCAQDEADRYRLHENTLQNEGYVRMFLEKIALMHKYCHGVNSVLDYGCGPEPVLAELLKREGFDCDIYDPHFFPDLPDRSYDLIISTEAFEHFRDVKGEMQKICSHLAPGSYLAVMTSFHDAARDFEHWWYTSDPTHICFFGARTFEWIAKEFGFKIIYKDNKNFIILQKEKRS